MSRSNTSYIIRLFVLVVSIAFVGADLTVSAQNTNSSTTQEDTSMQNSNMSNMNMNRGGRRRRGRGRRRRGGNMNATDTMTTDTTATDTATTMPTTTQYRTGRCDPNVQEQTDLSGTYTGTANYAEGGLSGETTLTITGNDFTMTSGSSTQEGRVVAVTTCNYTAVTMMFGKAQTTAATGSQPAALPAVSLRARRTGGGLSLMSVPGESRQFSFSSSGGGGGNEGRPRGRRRRRGRTMAIKPPTDTAHAQSSEISGR